MNQTAQRRVMKNSPGWSMQSRRPQHCHDRRRAAAVTPLPGVSAPAGLRPSPLEPLFAAAQQSLCPVSKGNAG